MSTLPAVTIQKRGMLSLNKAAYTLLGAPQAVELLWDVERRVIGLRGAELSNPNAYPARPQGKDGSNRGPYLVAGTLFTQFIGLDTSVAKRWVPKIEDGILCIDLEQPGQVATGPRSGKRVAMPS